MEGPSRHLGAYLGEEIRQETPNHLFADLLALSLLSELRTRRGGVMGSGHSRRWGDHPPSHARTSVSCKFIDF